MRLATAGPNDRSAGTPPPVTIRRPEREDGAAVWQLVADSATLDTNSIYCNLLQCTHFSATCALAEHEGEIVGWVSGYIPPEEPDTYFVWQVCTAERVRGQGLARRLIISVLTRSACDGVTRLKSTITEKNAPSWALFNALAASLDSTLARAPHFERDAHFAGRHETEHMVSIGPFRRTILPVRRVA